MVRKSDRNKVVSEKTEKPSTSRKPTRASRRRKKSTSDSEPEPEVPTEETAAEIPLPPQVPEVAEAAEPSKTTGRRTRHRRQHPSESSETVVESSDPKANQEWNEDDKFWGESSKQTEAETPKMDKENSTWKIQSSNGSGGEIQKLKICRQRLTDSAESSSSPAKELTSPRRKRYRKRKDKDHHHPDDEAESTGSHTDPDTPTSTVLEVTLPPEPPNLPPDPTDTADSTKPLEEQEIPLPQDEPIATEKDSTSVEEIQAQTAAELSHDTAAEVKESEVEAVDITEDRKDDPASAQEVVAQDGAVTEKTASESVETVIIEPEADIELAADTVEVTVGESTEQKEDPEKGPAAEVGDEQVKPSEASAPDTTSTPDGEEVEEGELKPAKKPPRNLKLAVSNEDAMLQIAKKLNERAARFSKEATEEAARRLAPQKSSKENTIDEDEEEGEISRDPSSTKTLELKRLSDDDVEPANKKQERNRRPVSLAAATTSTSPSDTSKPNESEPSKQQDVSTELLLSYVPDVIEPVPEEEVLAILTPKEDEPEVREIISDDANSVGESGEIVEEEGELVEDVKKEERRKSVEDRHVKRVPSREEPKRSERRVTKESRDGSQKKSRKERRPSDEEPRAKKKYDKDDKEKKSPSKHKAERVDKPEIPKTEENHKSVRKIAIVSDDSKPIRRSISPPTKKASCILFITNLVRPFTIGQLKELLNRTGTISPNGFYIDKIKSKCFVKYNDVEMAIETRHALHGVRWPVTNPRTLRVEFSTDEAMEAVKKQAEEEDNAAKKQDLVAQNVDKAWLTEKDMVKPPRKPKNLVREWDMGKDVNEIAQVNDIKKGKEDEWGVKAKDRTKEDGRRRPISPSLERTTEPAKKIKRRDTDAPAKLLDDLFRKTKSTPCIYWLPLTAAQIAVKEEMRRQHMAEHQKRLAELRKSETSRRDKDKSRDRDRERERARDRRRK